MATLYILFSQKLNRYYIGSTDRFDERFQEHQRGQTTSTRNGRPWEIAFTQEYETYDVAHEKEIKLKRWKNKFLIEKIISDGKINS